MNDDDEFSEEEAIQRRDAVIRRMANTPPRHRGSKASSREKAKTTGAGRRGAKKRGARAKSP